MTGFLSVPNHNLAVDTWVSDGQARLGSLQAPYPQGTFHYIHAYWNAGYPTDLKLYGASAQGYPQLSYKPPPNPSQPGPVMSVSGNSWDKECPKVVVDAEEICEMNVTQGSPPSTARIQCAQ